MLSVPNDSTDLKRSADESSHRNSVGVTPRSLQVTVGQGSEGLNSDLTRGLTAVSHQREGASALVIFPIHCSKNMDISKTTQRCGQRALERRKGQHVQEQGSDPWPQQSAGTWGRLLNHLYLSSLRCTVPFLWAGYTRTKNHPGKPLPSSPRPGGLRAHGSHNRIPKPRCEVPLEQRPGMPRN